MTREDVNKIPLQMTSHFATEDEQVAIYTAKGNWPFKLQMIASTPNGKKSRVHFVLDGKVYKNRRALYAAMENL